MDTSLLPTPNAARAARPRPTTAIAAGRARRFSDRAIFQLREGDRPLVPLNPTFLTISSSAPADQPERRAFGPYTTERTSVMVVRSRNAESHQKKKKTKKKKRLFRLSRPSAPGRAEGGAFQADG